MQTGYNLNSNPLPKTVSLESFGLQKKHVIGIILIVALVAFEMFNFDTTRFALQSLLGDVKFIGLPWAAILAIAFCSIDFAGLARLFTPEQGHNEKKEVWYLMGAWLLGATMNAVMTWWAVSVTLLAHDFGNEVLGREQLLVMVPIFVAVLVWLTRILFIGAFSVAGEHLFDLADTQKAGQRAGANKMLAAKTAVLAKTPTRTNITTRQQPVRQPQRQSPPRRSRPTVTRRMPTPMAAQGGNSYR